MTKPSERATETAQSEATKAAEAKTIRPQTRPKPGPGAQLPSPRGHVFGRPMGASPAQRQKRANERNEPAGTITAKKSSETEGELLLFGTIGEDWFGEGITDTSFNDAIQALGDVQTIRLRVNSGGGDVFDATAIYNMLVKHPAHVIVEIEGVAASAATLISMAGDEIRISENAQFMIHAASGIAWGNADELKQYLKLLDNADELIRLTYAARTGLSDAELVGMMDHDNWMTAKEALDLGFVDSMDPLKSVKPHVTRDQASAGAQSIQRPGAIKPERLAAMASNLSTLAANVIPTHGARLAASTTSKPTGSSPLTVPVKKEPNAMKLSAKLRAKCVTAGMSDKLTDDEASKWYDDHEDAVLTGGQVVTPAEKPKGIEGVDGNGKPLSAQEIIELVNKANAAHDQAKAEKRKAWRKEVDANVALAFPENPPTGLLDDCYGLSEDGIDAVRVKIQASKKAADEKFTTANGRINFSASQPRDRHISAIRTGVIARCLTNFSAVDGVKSTPAQILEKHLPAKDRPAGWEDFSRMPLIKISEECCLADGMSYDQVRRMSAPEIAQAALGFGSGRLRNDAALHTTGSLAIITTDAINKSLLAGYEEAPATWRGPGRQGTSVADFKTIHRIKLGAVSNLPVWTDTQDPEQALLSNEQEQYAVEARALTLSFSWRLVLNDDLDALSRRPQLLGDACARTVNAVFWQQITSNPTMTDSVALFSAATGNRKRANLVTGASTPTNTSIGSMRKLMRLMRGLNTAEQNESDDVLNLTPAFIIGPAALEELILKQVMSGADPALTGSSAVYNTARNLTPVIEPLLDATSATAFYLSASPSRIDTVEVTFLQGQETPMAHEWMDNKTMSQNYTIVQTFAAKAIDYRGLIRNDGV